MTQLKANPKPPSWKEREVNGNCEFGVKSYLHQFYDGPESVDLDLYEDEEFEKELARRRGRGRRRHLYCAGWLRPLLILSLLLLASAGAFLLLLLLLPPRLALVTSATDVTAAQLAALAAACIGAAGTLIAVCLMLEIKSNLCGRRERRAARGEPMFVATATPPSPVQTKVPATAELISIQPDAAPRYDVTQ